MASLDSILIVDDEQDNLEALRRLLRNLYEVTITTSPFEALKLVQKGAYHVIVSDQRMPEMTGVELLEKVKNVAPATVRILLTGYTEIESVIGAINRGNIYRYVAKPWDPEDLKLTLRQANESYHLRRELEMKNEALQKSLEELRLLDRAKARFLSLISHELNTPLTVMSSFVSLLQESEKQFPADVRKAVTSLGAASQRLSEIVAEVLTYTRLESESHLALAPFDFIKETRALKSELEKEFKAKKNTLELVGSLETLPRCDADKMRVALRKLLHDSFRRSPEKERIKVRVGTENGNVLYEVWRPGEPLSEEAFKPLETAADPLRHQKNLGLSLAIFRLIVEGHGGEVRLHSTASKGTTITLLLPMP